MNSVKINKKKAIISDFDDCIVDFLPFLCHVHNTLYQTCLSEHDIKEWDFEQLDVTDVRGNRVTGQDLLNTFHKYEPHGLYASLPVIKEARFALKMMKDLGYKIIIITARKPEYREQTMLNLIKNNLVYDEIYFEKDKVSKIKELAKRYQIEVFADDKLSTVESVAEKCKVKYNCLVEKAHNREKEIGEDILRINSLFEAVRYLKEVKG